MENCALLDYYAASSGNSLRILEMQNSRARKSISTLFVLGDSPASDLYMPTFRNTLSVPSSKAGVKYASSIN